MSNFKIITIDKNDARHKNKTENQSISGPNIPSGSLISSFPPALGRSPKSGSFGRRYRKKLPSYVISSTIIFVSE